MKTSELLMAVMLFCLLQSQGQAQNQQGSNPEFEAAMARATALVGQGSFDDALAVLDSLAIAMPDNFRVWSGKGRTLNAAGKYKKAIPVFEKALKINSDDGRTWFGLGVAQINTGKKDAGFESLVKAKETGTINTTNVNAFPIYQKIEGDPRVAKLFPTKEEFADPFVEDTKIIHEWAGEAEGDQFGWIARNLGDVDSDGIDDMVTSAPTNDEGGNNAGKIYVYSGKSGKLLWSAIGEAENGRLGMGVEYGGDINNDGTPDVVAAAPFINKAYAYSGKDGSVIHRFEGDSTGGFGLHLSGVGDFNGDGYGEILIGEPYQVFNAPINGDKITHPGKAHLFSGKDGKSLMVWEGEETDDAFGTAVAGRVLEGHKFLMVGAPNAGPGNGGRTYVYKDIKQEPDFVLEADSTGARFGGMFMSIIGDMNADGIHDLYSSDWPNNANGQGTGRAYVFSGKDGEVLHTLTGETPGEGFGIGVSDCGDVDGDGYADMAVGSWQFSGAAPGGGKVRLHSGKDGSLIRAWTCKTMGDTFGFDTTGLGDVDGDGTIDLLITSAWSAVKGFRSGRVFVIRSL